MSFPRHRNRRLRGSVTVRRLVRETVLTSSDFIYPMFVRYGKEIKEEITSMPGCYRYSVDKLVIEVRKLINIGVSAFILFGIPEKKDELAKGAYDKNGIVQVAVRELKRLCRKRL